MAGAANRKLAERLNALLRTQCAIDGLGTAVHNSDTLAQDLRGEIDALTSLAEQKRLSAPVDLVQHSKSDARIETAILLAYATNWLMNSFISVRKENLNFAEFKAALRPEQAGRMAKRTMQVGAKVRAKTAEFYDDPDKPYRNEMAFYLVAVSLCGKAGADWVDADLEERIDELITKSVLFLEKFQTRMPTNLN